MTFTPENIFFLGAVLIFASIVISKWGYRFGVPTLLLFLFRHRRVRHFCVPDFFGLFAAADDFGDVHDHTAVAGHDLRHLAVPLLNHVLLHNHR